LLAFEDPVISQLNSELSSQDSLLVPSSIYGMTATEYNKLLFRVLAVEIYKNDLFSNPLRRH